MKAYLYYFVDDENPTNPMWYAGLGVPFKLTPNFAFASSVEFDSTATHMLIKQLEKFYGKTFHQVTLTDAMPTPHSRCADCGVAWTVQEEKVARLIHGWETEEGLDDEWVRKDLTPYALSLTHLGSILRAENAESLSFGAKIHGARRCINEKCGELFCANCAPPRRGRTAGSCKICKPSRRRG